MKSVLALCGLLIFHVANLFGATNYQLIDLDLKSYKMSQITSLNEAGYICGHMLDGSDQYIFVIGPNKKMDKRCERITSYQITINNKNEIFGSVVKRVSDQYWRFNEEHIYCWKNPFSFFQLFNFDYLGFPENQFSTPSAFVTNAVWHANDLGQFIVMNKSTLSEVLKETSNPKTLIWIHDKGVFHQIRNKQLEGAFKINNHSQILGYFKSGSTLNKNLKDNTVVYNYVDKSIRVIDLSSSSIGYDLNDNGQVVGICYQPENDVWIGFLAEPTGEIIYMHNFKPKAINNKGQVLGRYLYDEKKDQIAIWESGIFYDLKDLTCLKDDKGNDWDSLDFPVDINDAGWIVGGGKIKGKNHGFLLKPLKK